MSVSHKPVTMRDMPQNDPRDTRFLGHEIHVAEFIHRSATPLEMLIDTAGPLGNIGYPSGYEGKSSSEKCCSRPAAI
jgi:hypothetical protein